MKKFQAICNSASPFSLNEENLSCLCDHLGIEATNHRSQQVVSERLKELILQQLKPAEQDEYITYVELYKLRDAYIYYQGLYNDSEYDECLKLIETLFYLGGNSLGRLRPFTAVQQWSSAISYLKCYATLHKSSNIIVPKVYQKQYDRIEAVKYIKRYGVKVYMNSENELCFENEHLVAKRICEKVRAIGGTRFVEKIISVAEYNADIDRLQLPVSRDELQPFSVLPLCAWGYLLNIGLRMTGHKGSEENLKKYFKEVILLSNALCRAVYNVQSYSIWEDIFHTDIDIREYFRKLTLSDSIYYLQQNSKSFCKKFFSFLLDELDKQGITMSPHYTLQEYKEVMLAMIDTTDYKKFVRLNCCDINILPNKQHQYSIIEDITKNCVNPCYELPCDYDRVNYSESPSIRLSQRTILLYPTTIGVWGWYELLLAKIRQQNSHNSKVNGRHKTIDIDNKVGSLLELFLKNSFAEKGIVTYSGRYNTADCKGECDIVLETKDKIWFIEVKKKTMTRNARKGYIYQIILDLAGSLVSSQEQALRAQRCLMVDGTLKLEKSSNEHYVLPYNNRKIERMTLTLNDYGALQENIIAENIMDEFVKCRFSVNVDEINNYEPDGGKQSEIVKGFDNLTRKQNSIINLLNDIEKQDSEYVKRIFFNTAFFNMEQLYYLIQLSDDVEHLNEIFNSLKYVSFGTKNFWIELPLKIVSQKK